MLIEGYFLSCFCTEHQGTLTENSTHLNDRPQLRPLTTNNHSARLLTADKLV